MSTVKVVTKVFYYVVSNDLTYHTQEDVYDVVNSDEIKFIIKKSVGYSPFQSNAGDVWQNYAASMELLHPSGNSAPAILENEWKLEMDHFGMTGGYAYTTMWIKFTDTFGFSAKETFNISIEDFIKAYKRFQKLSQFEGYKYAKLFIEHEELVTENEILKEKIDILTSENVKLKSKLSTFS